MLRRDTKAAFETTGWGPLRRHRFVVERLEAPGSYSRGSYARLLRAQAESPVCLMTEPGRRRAWWMFEGEFYWEDEELAAQEVKALLLERTGQRKRRLQRAIALMEQEPIESAARERIADDVRAFVWNRDGGRCARCGGNERLEFDHIIPVSLGGANTARNLQLLCEACNRAKGATV